MLIKKKQWSYKKKYWKRAEMFIPQAHEGSKFINFNNSQSRSAFSLTKGVCYTILHHSAVESDQLEGIN